jgi:uncharacterized protein
MGVQCWMRFTWDESKRAANLMKHGLDLLDGRRLLDGRKVFSYASVRENEARFVSVGLVGEWMLAVVWMEREDDVRRISWRRARRAETREYRELHG